MFATQYPGIKPVLLSKYLYYVSIPFNSISLKNVCGLIFQLQVFNPGVKNAALGLTPNLLTRSQGVG